MMSGKKRSRPPPMKRTTSITEFAFDLNHKPTNNNNQQTPAGSSTDHDNKNVNPSPPVVPVTSCRSTTTTLRRRHETSEFLRACYLCKRRLISGRDIFMYRGDNAFCSLECREQQMNLDEKKDKCSIPSNKHNSTTSESVAAI